MCSKVVTNVRSNLNFVLALVFLRNLPLLSVGGHERSLGARRVIYLVVVLTSIVAKAVN